MEFSVWLSIAGLALIWANLVLWQTRRVLNRLRHHYTAPELRLVPAAGVKVLANSVTTP